MGAGLGQVRSSISVCKQRQRLWGRQGAAVSALLELEQPGACGHGNAHDDGLGHSCTLTITYHIRRACSSVTTICAHARAVQGSGPLECEKLKAHKKSPTRWWNMKKQRQSQGSSALQLKLLLQPWRSCGREPGPVKIQLQL